MVKTTTNNQNTRQKILDVAAELFAAQGYNGVSVREIAEAAEVTKPVIYYYFNNKKELYDTIIQDAFENMIEIHEMIFNSDEPVDEQLRELMRSHFRFCLNNPDIMKVLYDAIGRNISEQGFTPNRHSSIKKEQNGFRKFSDFIENGQKAGFIKSTIDPAKAGMMMLGAMNIFILMHLHSDRKLISDSIANEVMDMFFYGITNQSNLTKENVVS